MSEKLTVAISTMGDRAFGVCLPVSRDDVEYVVVVQRPPENARNLFPGRDDVRVYPVDHLGLSKSRNEALSHARGEFIMLCDDDIELDIDGILKLADGFAEHPKAALISGRLLRGDGEWMSRYADESHKFAPSNSGRLQSASILMRRKVVIDAGVRFDEGFGLGTDLPLGEEYIFATDLMKKGYEVWFKPITVGMHPMQSTGANWSDRKIMRARSKVIGRVFGKSAPVIRCAYLAKNWKMFPGMMSRLRFVVTL